MGFRSSGAYSRDAPQKEKQYAKTAPVNIVLSIGSNVPQRCAKVEQAIVWVNTVLHKTKCSDIYETAPLNGSGSYYANAVIGGETDLSFSDFVALTKEYERRQGRDDDARKRGEVVVDIDVVIADGEIIRQRDYNCYFFRKGYDALSDAYLAAFK